MAQQREATTDRLVGIIASIKMERRSGRLLVRRGEGLTSEEGTLVFVQGQVAEAHVGRRSGANALNWLSTWGQTRYVFTPLTSNKDTPIPMGGFDSAFSPAPGRAVTSPLQPINTDKLEPTVSGIPSATVALAEAATRIERAGLSRAHRHLYLLIDGQRSTFDFVPLVGKKVEEVRNMLHDLAWLGVIQFSSPPPEEP